MKRVLVLAVVCLLAMIDCQALTIYGADGTLKNSSGEDFATANPATGAIRLNREPKDSVSAVYGAESTTATAGYCKNISGVKPGAPIRSCGFESKEDARSVAFTLLADKVNGHPGIEFSTGVYHDEKTGLYYPVSPIKGDGKRVVVPSQNGIVENMHYHPQSSKAVASLLDLAASNETGIPGFIVTGKNGMVSTDLLRYNPDGTYQKYQWNNGIVSEAPNSQPRLLSELCSQQQQQTFDEIMNNLTKETLVGAKGHVAACPSETIPARTMEALQSPTGTESGYVSGTANLVPANLAPASQSYTIDNTAMKQWASQQLEGAYQYASGIAAEEGVGAEYQSAVAPVMSQGRAAISSIPDQQTVTVPTQVQPQ